ncbi:phosphatidylglycerol lysyltransferase [Luteibacter sp. Sphag1AF]|uniref:lysylphosphatidylglycerol synthase transmembrane domain-containing protein n=1 Tax=Luteibacter sp. Sphag1AF TaxID=2587031 RepID=UPI0016105503|nr:YbhN family protein [Luteibacter sp. Sphag1AF]MBB3226523.1 phosphatidylglycerol lysyltransferase [Luteibacter sp. Sphag1AF]
MTRRNDAPRPRRAWLGPVIHYALAIFVVAAAAWVLDKYISKMSWRDVLAALERTPRWHVVGSVAATLVSWAALATYDLFAVRTVVPGQVSTRMALFSGTTSHAICNALGFHAITGTALRYRLLSTRGVTAPDVARIVGLVGFSVAMGFAAITCIALMLEPSITHGWGRWPGVVLILAFAILLKWLSGKHTDLRIGKFSTPVPSARSAGAQIVIGTVEMTAAIAAMYLLLPPELAGSFIDFIPIYMGAVIAGIVSNAPGGIGAFEALTLASFPEEARPQVLAALLAYRVIYGLFPFVVSSLALVAFEIRRRSRVRRGVSVSAH